MAFVYSDWSGAATSNLTTYRNFAESQINYVLGATGRSFLIGFGTNPPQHPHHRTAESSWANDMSIPPYARHTLYGAMVGGPDSSDSYTDTDQNYTQNEPACDYNAGLIASLSRMYKVYGGSPIANFTGAIEVPSNVEFFVQTQPNSTGANYFEVAAWLNNMSGWPARPGTNLSFRYFINTSEFVANGYSDTNVTITVNYNQGNATVTPYLIPWDAPNHIYYVNVDFGKTNIYPGGQGIYQMQVQFRVAAPQNTSFWNNSNDWSYQGGMTTNNPNQNVPVYMSGVKIYGNEPPIGASSSSSSSSSIISSSSSSSSSASSIISSSPSSSSSASSIITSSSSISSSSSSIASSSSSSISNGGYAVDYNITSDWGTGETVTVTVKNNTAAPLSSWTLAGISREIKRSPRSGALRIRRAEQP